MRWHFADTDADVDAVVDGCGGAAAVPGVVTEVALAVDLHCTMYRFHRNMHEISLSRPAS